ncbi:MAG TPA: aromatic ring-hydroxylating dioxygenase subunit alpha [Chloroflexota bacterium]|nr:aromatic ring-hydroxylating dioxygenase subunit alpha [Chloroflexota bacterium]
MELADLIVDRPEAGLFRVHRSAMTSPELFALEQRRIFERGWLYVGYDGEIPRPGDYRRRTVAGRPLFFVRGSDGQVRVLFNTCTHRGAMVCRRDEGNAAVFQCFYHAWTFDNRGALIGTPDPDGYAPGFDRAERALQAPPHVGSYRGLHFVSFNPDVAPLADYLGPARELMDLSLDSAEVLGGWTILAGTAKYAIRANWKLLVENSIDAYHFASVHQTYIGYMASQRAKAGAGTADADTTKSVTAGLSATARGFALPGGHAGFLSGAPGRGIASPSPLWSDAANREVERVRALLVARYGEARGREMAERSRHLLIFPNLLFQDSHTGFRFRQIWPVAPDQLEVLQWELVPRDEHEAVRAYRLENSLLFLGPGGFGTPDDVEALESCQLGFRAAEVEWSDVSRGLHRDPLAEDEAQMRGFWRQWHALVQGLPTPPPTTDRPGAPSPTLSRA